MEKKKRKRYEKPKVTRINLDAKCAVLGFCKTDGSLGPGGNGGNTCRWSGGSPCSGPGS